MNIINNTTTKPQVLGILDTQQNVVYRGEQSRKLYLGVRENESAIAYLVELGSAYLHRIGQCYNDKTFVVVEADVVVKN